MKNSYAKFLLKKTEDDYNKISSLFSNKRAYLSPDVLAFKKYLPQSGWILDYGCGNGRISAMIEPSLNYLGVDTSGELIKIAKAKYPDKTFEQIAPFSKPSIVQDFDLIFCLAVLHHIPSREMRIKLLKQLRKLLKPDGKLVLTVWNLWPKKEVKSLLLRNSLKRILRFSQLDSGDIFYPFKDLNGHVMAERYLHCFHEEELVQLVKEAGFKIIKQGINTRGKRVVNSNIFVVAGAK